MSWGGKSSSYNWQLEWDGDLSNGTQVYLKAHGSMTAGNYFASNAGEGSGMSWGGKSSNYNWQLEWDSGCLFSAGTGTNALQQTLNQDLTGNAQAAAQSSTNAAEEIGGFDNPRYNPKTYAGCDRNRCETLSHAHGVVPLGWPIDDGSLPNYEEDFEWFKAKCVDRSAQNNSQCDVPFTWETEAFQAGCWRPQNGKMAEEVVLTAPRSEASMPASTRLAWVTKATYATAVFAPCKHCNRKNPIGAYAMQWDTSSKLTSANDAGEVQSSFDCQESSPGANDACPKGSTLIVTNLGMKTGWCSLNQDSTRPPLDPTTADKSKRDRILPGGGSECEPSVSGGCPGAGILPSQGRGFNVAWSSDPSPDPNKNRRRSNGVLNDNDDNYARDSALHLCERGRSPDATETSLGAPCKTCLECGLEGCAHRHQLCTSCHEGDYHRLSDQQYLQLSNQPSGLPISSAAIFNTGQCRTPLVSVADDKHPGKVVTSMGEDKVGIHIYDLCSPSCYPTTEWNPEKRVCTKRCIVQQRIAPYDIGEAKKV
jgi:hypothetical protein